MRLFEPRMRTAPGRPTLDRMPNGSRASSNPAAARHVEGDERLPLDDETIRDLDEGLAELERGDPAVDAREILSRLRKKK